MKPETLMRLLRFALYLFIANQTIELYESLEFLIGKPRIQSRTQLSSFQELL